MGRYTGVATVVGDPDPVGRSVVMVISVEGRRYEARTYGRTARIIDGLESGRLLVVSGERAPFDSARARRAAIRHVVGRFDVESVDVESPGPGQRGVDLAANRLRHLMRDGARHLSTPSDELFAGLVYGDDRAQPDEMVRRFRASGLAHLTAVSGQNVVYLLTVFGPLLRRMRRWWRLGATLTLLTWFVVLTRVEPSVVRAATMAGVAAVGFAVGGRHHTGDVLAVSVMMLLVVDPFLAWSVGWWMSVGGTVGLVYLGPLLTRAWSRFRGCETGVVGRSLIAAVAAQSGVLPVSLAVFGWPNALALPCNLAAVPVAGMVMLVGIPSSITAGLLPDPLGRVVMWPVGIMVGWVDAAARFGERMRPSPVVDAVVTISMVIIVAGVTRHRLREARWRVADDRSGVPTLGDGRVPLPRIR